MRLGVTAFLTDRSMPPGALGKAAEERGFHSLYLPEHTHLPLRADTPPSLVEGVDLEDYRRGLDPLVALGMAAQATTRLRLGTGVLLVAQHDPIVLAKQLATLDHLSGGRVVLGVGFGWNRAEAADHGVDFARRREVARDHLRCMHALWSMDQPAYHGEHVDLPPCWSWPKPLQQPRLRTLVGGGATDAVFGAVAEHGDGWLPIGSSGIAEALPRLRERVARAGRDPGAVAVVPFGVVATEGKLAHLAGLGLDEVVLRVRSGPEDAMLRQLDHLARFLPATR